MSLENLKIELANAKSLCRDLGLQQDEVIDKIQLEPPSDAMFAKATRDAATCEVLRRRLSSGFSGVVGRNSATIGQLLTLPSTKILLIPPGSLSMTKTKEYQFLVRISWHCVCDFSGSSGTGHFLANLSWPSLTTFSKNTVLEAGNTWRVRTLGDLTRVLCDLSDNGSNPEMFLLASDEFECSKELQKCFRTFNADPDSPVRVIPITSSSALFAQKASDALPEIHLAIDSVSPCSDLSFVRLLCDGDSPEPNTILQWNGNVVLGVCKLPEDESIWRYIDHAPDIAPEPSPTEQEEFLQMSVERASWALLNSTKIVQRTQVPALVQLLSKTDCSKVCLEHQHGVGGSTLARQVLWAMRKQFFCAEIIGLPHDKVKALATLLGRSFASADKLDFLFLLDRTSCVKKRAGYVSASDLRTLMTSLEAEMANANLRCKFLLLDHPQSVIHESIYQFQNPMLSDYISTSKDSGRDHVLSLRMDDLTNSEHRNFEEIFTVEPRFVGENRSWVDCYGYLDGELIRLSPKLSEDQSALEGLGFTKEEASLIAAWVRTGKTEPFPKFFMGPTNLRIRYGLLRFDQKYRARVQNQVDYYLANIRSHGELLVIGLCQFFALCAPGHSVPAARELLSDQTEGPLKLGGFASAIVTKASEGFVGIRSRVLAEMTLLSSIWEWKTINRTSTDLSSFLLSRVGGLMDRFAHPNPVADVLEAAILEAFCYNLTAGTGTETKLREPELPGKIRTPEILMLSLAERCSDESRVTLTTYAVRRMTHKADDDQKLDLVDTKLKDLDQDSPLVLMRKGEIHRKRLQLLQERTEVLESNNVDKMIELANAGSLAFQKAFARRCFIFIDPLVAEAQIWLSFLEYNRRNLNLNHTEPLEQWAKEALALNNCDQKKAASILRGLLRANELLTTCRSDLLPILPFHRKQHSQEKVKKLEDRISLLLNPFKVDFEAPLCPLMATRILAHSSGTPPNFQQVDELLYATCCFAKSSQEEKLSLSKVQLLARVCFVISQYSKAILDASLSKLRADSVTYLKGLWKSLPKHLISWTGFEKKNTRTTQFNARVADLQFKVALVLSNPSQSNLNHLSTAVYLLQEDMKQANSVCFFPRMVILASSALCGQDWSVPLTWFCRSPPYDSDQGARDHDDKFLNQHYRRFRGTLDMDGSVTCSELGNFPITPFSSMQKLKATCQVDFTVEIAAGRESLFIARAVRFSLD